MKGDALASGQRSATFSAGQAGKDEPIEFHGTVAVEENLPEGTDPVIDNTEFFRRDVEPVRAVDFSKYQPMNDRVLLRRIQQKNESRVQIAEAFVQDSDIGEVIAVGDGMLIGGELRPIPLAPGDRVRFGHYNAEDIEVEGEKLVLVSAFDVRLKIKS